MCAALCGVGQPADLFDSGASGSLPRDTSGLFSEGPLMVAPGKRGGQVWRETEISLATTCRHPSNYPQSTQLHYMFSCCFLLLNMAENTKLRVVLLFLTSVVSVLRLFIILNIRVATSEDPGRKSQMWTSRDLRRKMMENPRLQLL